jgi:general secretion pathway protein K
MMLKRQRGVAVITALLLTTLAISIVASLFWQQQVQVRSMENQRLQLQTKWILRGALDWAMLVLRQDAIDNQKYTSLDQVWATPLADTRLDQYIERERVQGENFDATLSGNVTDAMSRYNLTNLANNGTPDPAQTAIFQRLLANLQMNPALAQQAAKFVAAGQVGNVAGSGQGSGGQGGTGGDGGPSGQTVPQQARASALKMVQVEDLLAIPGFTPQMVEKLRPFVIVLPEITPVDINTAPAEVLAALVPNLPVSQANGLVERRKRAPWQDTAQFATEANNAELGENVATVKSSWFLIDSRIKLDRASLNVQALVGRKAGNAALLQTTSVQWIRQN